MIKISKKFGREKGFTLTEVLIITAIIGIITLVSVPAISSWLASYRLSRDAQNISAELLLARARAVSERQSITFTINTGSGYSATYQFTPGGDVNRCGNSVTINSVSPSTSFTFNSRGMTSSAITINLSNVKGNTKAISVTIAGRISVN